jgi:hypothetical protein
MGQHITILLIIIEGLLIVISLKYLYQISVTSKEFSCVFGKTKAETYLLFKELQALITNTNSREDNILSVVYHLEDMELYIKKILKTLEQQGKPKVNEELSIK